MMVVIIIIFMMTIRTYSRQLTKPQEDWSQKVERGQQSQSGRGRVQCWKPGDADWDNGCGDNDDHDDGFKDALLKKPCKVHLLTLMLGVHYTLYNGAKYGSVFLEMFPIMCLNENRESYTVCNYVEKTYRFLSASYTIRFAILVIS